MVRALEELGLDEDTVLVVTSDHGDMLGSQGCSNKQVPWDESVRVPFLLRYPKVLGRAARIIETPIDAPDIMPTLLGLCGVAVPETVEGLDFSGAIHGGEDPGDGAALLACYSPYGQWTRDRGGKEYRGVRSARYTFVRDLAGPWLLYDNSADPYQLENLVNRPEHAALQDELDAALSRKLRATGDDFLPGDEYVRRWGYITDEKGTVPYTD